MLPERLRRSGNNMRQCMKIKTGVQNMRKQWYEVWSFQTANLRVVAEVTPCEDDPADHFGFPEDIEAVRSGKLEWFDARVRVLMCDPDDNPDYPDWSIELGADYLSGCAYARPKDLFRHHATLARQLCKLRHEHMVLRGHMRRTRKETPGDLGLAAAWAERLSETRREIAGLKRVLANNAALNPPVSYCEYGPDMVREACREARHTLRRMHAIPLRSAAA